MTEIQDRKHRAELPKDIFFFDKNKKIQTIRRETRGWKTSLLKPDLRHSSHLVYTTRRPNPFILVLSEAPSDEKIYQFSHFIYSIRMSRKLWSRRKIDIAIFHTSLNHKYEAVSLYSLNLKRECEALKS